MTYYQQQLLDKALEKWERGHRISLTLYAQLVEEGMDVNTLEAKHMKEPTT